MANADPGKALAGRLLESEGPLGDTGTRTDPWWYPRAMSSRKSTNVRRGYVRVTPSVFRRGAGRGLPLLLAHHFEGRRVARNADLVTAVLQRIHEREVTVPALQHARIRDEVLTSKPGHPAPRPFPGPLVVCPGEFGLVVIGFEAELLLDQVVIVRVAPPVPDDTAVLAWHPNVNRAAAPPRCGRPPRDEPRGVARRATRDCVAREDGRDLHRTLRGTPPRPRLARPREDGARDGPSRTPRAVTVALSRLGTGGTYAPEINASEQLGPITAG